MRFHFLGDRLLFDGRLLLDDGLRDDGLDGRWRGEVLESDLRFLLRDDFNGRCSFRFDCLDLRSRDIGNNCFKYKSLTSSSNKESFPFTGFSCRGNLFNRLGNFEDSDWYFLNCYKLISNHF